MSDRPDILIFNPDQWRGDVLGHMGNPAALTPNLDRLVTNDAVSFRNAFVQATVCTPSRCSFMTGWYPHLRGHRTMHYMLRAPDNEPNLLRVLKDSGYFVWWGGKNDLVAGQEGYEDHCDIAFRPHREDYERWGYAPAPGSHGGDMGWRGDPDGDNHYSFFKGCLDAGDKDVYFDHDWAMVYGALDFIRRYDGDQPMCIFLPIGYPHPPYCVEDPWYHAVDRDAIPQRTVVRDWASKPTILKGIYDGQQMQHWTEPRFTELRATYYGMCARVDHQWGLLEQALRERGLFDQTAAFIFSDHGDFTGDYGLVEKTQNALEDCLTRVPFIVKPPASTATRPGIRDGLVELVDFPATVYAMAGINPEYVHFGRDLSHMFSADGEHREAVFAEGGRLQGETQASERESFNEASLYLPRIRMQLEESTPLKHGKAAMCRTHRYKYIRRLYETDQLYDIESDPMELNNLVGDPESRQVLHEMRERLGDWYMATCDTVPLNPDSRWFVPE